MRFRDDTVINKLLNPEKKYNRNTVCIVYYLIIEGKKHMFTGSGYALNEKTIITTAHDLYGKNIYESYVINEDMINDEEYVKNNGKKVINIITHPDYVEKKYIPKNQKMTINDMINFDKRFENAKFILGTDKNKEFNGVDLAIIHIEDEISLDKIKIVNNEEDINNIFKEHNLIKSKIVSYGKIGLSNGEYVDIDKLSIKQEGNININYSKKYKILYSCTKSKNGDFNKFTYLKDEDKLIVKTTEGDSGCPLFINDKIVAINSRYTSITIDNVPFDITNFIIFIPIFPYINWIEQNTIK